MTVGQEAQLRVIQASPRGTALSNVCTYVRTYLAPSLSLLSRYQSEKECAGDEERRRRRGEGAARGERGAGERLCGIPAATYGNVIRAFRRMLSCVFALLRNRPPRVTLVRPDKGNQCQCARRAAQLLLRKAEVRAL